MTTAFVLSGGGSLGAVQVGMLQALVDRAIVPDLLVGTSAGAINAAYLAGQAFDRPAVDHLAGVWEGLRRRDVFPVAMPRRFRRTPQLRPALCSSGALRRLIEANVAYERLEHARITVHVVATDVISGIEVLLSEGDVVSATLASAALPAILPTVDIDGRAMFDGGVANNTPISHAVALGADRIVVIPAGTACALTTPPRSILATAVHAIGLLVQQRLAADIAACRNRVELIVLPPLCPLSISSTDFRHAHYLITRAQAATAKWLDSGDHRLPHPERFLARHQHGAGRGRSHDQSTSCAA